MVNKYIPIDYEYFREDISIFKNTFIWKKKRIF